MFYKFIRFIVNVILSLIYRVELIDGHKIPEEGRIILCSNHIHWIDPVVLACRCTKRPIHFMAKIELLQTPILGFLLSHLNVIGVKRGQSDVQAIKSSLRVLKDEKVLGIFPEGTRVKEGEVKEAESGFVMLGVKSKCPVVPVGIKGSYKIGSKITLKVGDPIILEEYYKKKLSKDELHSLSNDIMNEIHKLK